MDVSDHVQRARSNRRFQLRGDSFGEHLLLQELLTVACAGTAPLVGRDEPAISLAVRCPVLWDSDCCVRPGCCRNLNWGVAQRPALKTGLSATESDTVLGQCGFLNDIAVAIMRFMGLSVSGSAVRARVRVEVDGLCAF